MQAILGKLEGVFLGDRVQDRWEEHRRKELLARVREELDVIEENVRHIRRSIDKFEKKPDADLLTARQLLRQIYKAAESSLKRVVEMKS